MVMTCTDDESDRAGPPAFVIRDTYLKGMRVELRPIAQAPPPSCEVSVLYRREGDKLNQIGVGMLKDGKWLRQNRRVIDPAGLYWTAVVDER